MRHRDQFGVPPSYKVSLTRLLLGCRLRLGLGDSRVGSRVVAESSACSCISPGWTAGDGGRVPGRTAVGDLPQDRLADGGAGRAGPTVSDASLLGRSSWDAVARRDLVCSEVAAPLGDPDGGVLVLDETGLSEEGHGLARQYSGTAGRIENCQAGVFLGYASRLGRRNRRDPEDRANYLVFAPCALDWRSWPAPPDCGGPSRDVSSAIRRNWGSTIVKPARGMVGTGT